MSATAHNTPIPEALQPDYQACLQLAHSHYENFPVARLLPERLRPHVAAVYAFARSADDLADEGYNGQEDESQQQLRLQALAEFDREVTLAAAGTPGNPELGWIFRPLAHTLRTFQLPASLFHDLLSAFSQDVTHSRYASYSDLLDYCRRSANPVGRLVLLLHGINDQQLFAWSDAICSGLQLANFWQDVAVDWKKDRIYVPQEDWARYQVVERDFAAATASPNLRQCILFQVERTDSLFEQGRSLPAKLPFPLSWEIRLTLLGGKTILNKVRGQDGDTLASRPKIGTIDKIRLLLGATFRR